MPALVHVSRRALALRFLKVHVDLRSLLLLTCAHMHANEPSHAA